MCGVPALLRAFPRFVRLCILTFSMKDQLLIYLRCVKRYRCIIHITAEFQTMSDIRDYLYKRYMNRNTMQLYLSPDHSVMSQIVGYLPLRDMTRARASTRFLKTATDEWSGGWREYVQTNVTGVVDCTVCRALIQTIGPLNTLHQRAEWCASCGNIVCVDHLESIDGLICCGDCT